MPGVGSSKGVAKPKQAAAGTTGQGATNVTSDYKSFYSAIAKSPTLTRAWSKMLKASGYYKGPITDKYTADLQRALDNAEQERLSISAVRPLDRDTFINEQISLAGAGGAGGTQKRVESYISSPTQAAALIDRIFRDQAKRKATADEIKYYSNILFKAQKANPSVTTYTDGGATTTAMQTGGLDAEQFLIDKVAQTDEARANKVLDFYGTFMKALGA